MKLEAVLLYISGMSMNAIAMHLDVSAQAILNWIRDFARDHYEKPEPSKVAVVELDEMWHYLGSKKTSYGYGKHLTVIAGDYLTGNWEVVFGRP
jgi:transposase